MLVPLVVALIVVAVILATVGLFLVRTRRRGPAPAAERERPYGGPPSLPVRAEGLGGRIRSLFSGRAPGADEWGRLEELLVRADVGPKTAARIVQRVRDRYEAGGDAPTLVAQEIAAALEGDVDLSLRPGDLSVIMVVGVNGTGKTTTIGKLASRLSQRGLKVSLANSDTFRAAAGEQINVWAARAGVHLVSQKRGADPGAVAFDAAQAARSRGSDVLIVDTAGRLHTRQPLMEELAKVKRVLEKAAGDVQEVLLVVDATTGQNGLQQARVFTDAVGVTGVALTKLDGTARGGIVLAVREELGVPVKLIGTGEGVEDLQPFDPALFAERLLAA
jgi:fused signal recognition particle receptor